jgi:hypothetical protein
MQIDHDKDEPPRDRSGMGIYWAVFAFLVLLWIGYLSFNAPDWWGISIGAGSGLFLATWAIEITGNKAPKWMRR